MQKKLYRMDDESLEVIHEFMRSKGIYSETQAINFICRDYVKKINEKAEFDRVIDERNKPILANLRRLEKEIHTIKDVVNTTLFEYPDARQLLPADSEEGNYKHRVLRESEERYDANLAKMWKKKNKCDEEK